MREFYCLSIFEKVSMLKINYLMAIEKIYPPKNLQKKLIENAQFLNTAYKKLLYIRGY
jgi:hypothetical protein